MSYREKKPANETKKKISKAARHAGMEAMSKAMTQKVAAPKKHKARKI